MKPSTEQQPAYRRVGVIYPPPGRLYFRTVPDKANLRDQLAMSALPLVAGDPERQATPEMLAARAYAIADAMLERREVC